MLYLLMDQIFILMDKYFFEHLHSMFNHTELHATMYNCTSN